MLPFSARWCARLRARQWNCSCLCPRPRSGLAAMSSVIPAQVQFPLFVREKETLQCVLLGYWWIFNLHANFKQSISRPSATSVSKASSCSGAFHHPYRGNTPSILLPISACVRDYGVEIQINQRNLLFFNLSLLSMLDLNVFSARSLIRTLFPPTAGTSFPVPDRFQ